MAVVTVAAVEMAAVVAALMVIDVAMAAPTALATTAAEAAMAMAAATAMAVMEEGPRADTEGMRAVVTAAAVARALVAVTTVTMVVGLEEGGRALAMTAVEAATAMAIMEGEEMEATRAAVAVSVQRLGVANEGEGALQVAPTSRPRSAMTQARLRCSILRSTGHGLCPSLLSWC